MEHAKMMTLTPIEAHPTITQPQIEEPIKRPEKIKIDPLKKKSLTQIALKIAGIGGYDDDLRIKTLSGKPMNDTNIIGLILHSLTPMENTNGLTEFVDLLYRAKVNPDLIKNADVRMMLEKREEQGKWKLQGSYQQVEPTVLAVSGPEPKKKKRRNKFLPVDHPMALRKKRKIKTETKINKRPKSKLWDDHDSDLD